MNRKRLCYLHMRRGAQQQLLEKTEIQSENSTSIPFKYGLLYANQKFWATLTRPINLRTSL